jgi:ankyrin repeat protein
MNINSFTFHGNHIEKLFSKDRGSLQNSLIDPAVIPDDPTDCIICLYNIFGSHSITILHPSKKLPSSQTYSNRAPGMHFFHTDCLNEYQVARNDEKTCPTCRSVIYDKNYFSSVANAVASNQSADVICKLIDDGADCNAMHSSEKMTAIHIATKKEHVDLIKTLLAKGADINIKDGTGNTALHYAVETENLEILEILLKQNPDINVKNGVGDTVLHYAIEAENLEMLEILLANNPDVNIQGLGKITALQRAAGKPQCPELFSAIMAHNPNLEIEDAKKLRAIHYAAESGHQVALEALIAKGVDVNAVDDNNRTALHYINTFRFEFYYPKNKNRVTLAKTLIAAGARVDIVSGNGYTVFDGNGLWSYEGRELVRVMLYPAVENFENVKKIFTKQNILYYAFLAKDKEIVKKLVAKGARIDDEKTPEVDLRCLDNEKQEFLDLLSNE